MGESLLDSPKVDNKMGESVTNMPCFQQSVSFGRFERDSLCWERWSTFPTNKYLEEVEKCSTPGSVAQKKAYFEAHYKKIAARRAELLLDQEREREAELVEFDDSASANLTCNTDEKDEVGSLDQDCMLQGSVSPSSNQTVHSGTESVGELDRQRDLYMNPVPFYESIPETESNAEVCNTVFDGEVTVEHVHVHVKSNIADVFCQENEMGSFDDKVTVEHVRVKSDIPDVQDRPLDVNPVPIYEPVPETESNAEVCSTVYDGEVTVEQIHVKSNIADVFCQENEMGSFGDDLTVEHVRVNSDILDVQENDDGALNVNDVCELSNVTSELCEDIDLDIEVTKDICEVNDCVRVVDEIVKTQVEHFEYPDDGADLIKSNNNTQSQDEFISADLCLTSKKHELGKPKLPDTPSILKSKGEELPLEKVKRTIVEVKSKNLMKSVMTKTQKATLVKKTVSSANTKKQSPTPVPKRTSAPMSSKSTMLLTPKSAKPDLSKGARSAGRLPDKKENGFTPPTVKKTTEPQSRRLIPTSLHMSLSLGPMNTDQASHTMRKSLIMERMGDKDIVKRAFKAFQNPPASPSSFAKSPVPNQSVSRKAEQKVSPANTISNKNERIGKAAKTADTRTGQQGIRKTSMFPKLNRSYGADQRNVKSVAASFGPRVLLQGKSQNEVSKKLDLQASTNVLGTTNLLSKHKVEKAAELNKLSYNINTKPKTPSSYGHKHGGSLHKVDGKGKTTS